VLRLLLSLAHIVLVSELRPWQNEPEEVHPNGHVPLDGFGTASWAPALGTQNDPEVK
jgi:hypothetical protein